MARIQTNPDKMEKAKLMAKKPTIASEIGSALGAVAARAEQLIASNTTKKATKPAAKRTAAAKHSTTASKKTVLKETAAPAEVAVAKEEVAETPVISSVMISEVVVSNEAISEQAYLYWESRGCQGGDPVSDWVRAEDELKQRAMAAKA
jgi:Protein of unknown function (DUF2934)